MEKRNDEEVAVGIVFINNGRRRSVGKSDLHMPPFLLMVWEKRGFMS